MANRSYIGFATTPHDSAIAIVNENGEIVFAEAAERYLQCKRAINIAPDILYRTGQLIEEYCDPKESIVAAFSWSDQRVSQHRALLNTIEDSEQKLTTLFGSVPDYLQSELDRGRYLLQSNLAMEYLSGEALELELSRLGRNVVEPIPRRRFPHHRTHAAAACFTSPFAEAVCAVIDGYGEDAACAFYRYVQGSLHELTTTEAISIPSPASLGQFYERICTTCGFDPVSGEEWKVMGLAALGQHDERLYELFRSMLRVNDLRLEPAETEVRQISQWQELWRLRRRSKDSPLHAANIAFTAQRVFAEVLYELLNNLYHRGYSQNLVLSGGCALNSSANGEILNQTGFRNLHVFCAPADDGNAVGAALLAWQEDHPHTPASREFQSPYLGSRMSGETLEQLKTYGRLPRMTDCKSNAPERAAHLLSQGKIIGWIQGRAEFGPRALGNRSILADPRSPTMKNEINARVKFREEFRPFAPSILHEYGPMFFEHYQESPFMERALRFREGMKELVPAVVHEDGTGRLQTLKQEWNPGFYQLVKCFYDLTGVPLVLNTSYNVMGKPITHSVEDALSVYFTSGLDALFLEDLLLEK